MVCIVYRLENVGVSKNTIELLKVVCIESRYCSFYKSSNIGITPLSRALAENHTQIADLLRDAGAHESAAGVAGAHESSDEEPSDEGSSEETA